MPTNFPRYNEKFRAPRIELGNTGASIQSNCIKGSDSIRRPPPADPGPFTARNRHALVYEWGFPGGCQRLNFRILREEEERRASLAVRAASFERDMAKAGRADAHAAVCLFDIGLASKTRLAEESGPATRDRRQACLHQQQTPAHKAGWRRLQWEEGVAQALRRDAAQRWQAQALLDVEVTGPAFRFLI